MKLLNVIGCGRVGQTLARLLQEHGVCPVQDLYVRSAEKSHAAVEFIGAGRAVSDLRLMRPADIWMLSVPDGQVALAAESLAQTLDLRSSPPGPAVAFHCSGFLPANALVPLRRHGWRLASAHPSLNFASPQTGIRQFPGTPCGLEGDRDAAETVGELLTAVGGQCFLVDTAAKPLYHAAAVFCSNFTVVLQGIAREAWLKAGVPEQLLPQLTAALLGNTVENVLALGPAAAITGPAARGDREVVQRQGEVVAQWHPRAGEIYREMSELASKLARTGIITESGIAE